jgi:TolB-like protein
MVLSAGNCAAKEVKTIGVLSIRCNSAQIGNIITESLTADIAKIKSCNVVERIELNRVFEERILTDDGIVEQIRQGSGKAIGLNYVLMGSANAELTQSYNKVSKEYEYQNSVVINLKLIDACDQVGKIVWSGQRTVENYNNDVITTAQEAAYDMARQIYEVFPVQGYILKLDQGKIYIDLGKKDGIKKKDKLIVEGIKDTIIHPITGEKIVTKDIVGKLKVSDVFDDFCVAEFDRDLFKIYPGDIVNRQICSKPRGILGLGWSGAHEF